MKRQKIAADTKVGDFTFEQLKELFRESVCDALREHIEVFGHDSLDGRILFVHESLCSRHKKRSVATKQKKIKK